jgi:hypothetical protein
VFSRDLSFLFLVWEILFPALFLPVLGTVQIYNRRWSGHALIRCPRQFLRPSKYGKNNRLFALPVNAH